MNSSCRDVPAQYLFSYASVDGAMISPLARVTPEHGMMKCPGDSVKTRFGNKRRVPTPLRLRCFSEAINSMDLWYSAAEVCYVHLQDVPPCLLEDCARDGSPFRNSNWFKRGWTLQELVYPPRLAFSSSDWTFISNEDSLSMPLEEITGVSTDSRITARLHQHGDIGLMEINYVLGCKSEDHARRR
ncbi:hypothetical protein F4778DRAFT_509772 [Xylariomycetidae sp. FL2044]|nr:hypothetical protein F4778DRAFT_509772 [Xylariomycetidae sp. FL2044]